MKFLLLGYLLTLRIINTVLGSLVYLKKIDTNQKYKITCKEEIHDIVQNINSGHRELAIFMADVMVDLVYKNNKKITILIRKNKFKIDGVTYVSSDTILNTRLIHGKNNN